MDALIERLNQRIQHAPAIELDAACVYTNEAGEILPPRRPNPRASLADVSYVQHKLGFVLPEIVRRIATEVADGGYGPNWGINRLRHPPNVPFGPFWEVKMSVESWHQLYHEEDDGNRWRDYPSQFIRFCEVGCNISVCIDCTSKSGSLFLDDPMSASEPIRTMPQTIEEWLWEWLDKTPWPTTMYS